MVENNQLIVRVMAVLQLILIGEFILSLFAGYFFAGMQWGTGALFLFAALIANIRTEKIARKKQKSFVNLTGRVSDAFIFAGVAVGASDFLALGLFVLFLMVFVPHITCRIRELRGLQNMDFGRKYRLFVIIVVALAEKNYPGTIAVGLAAAAGLAVYDLIKSLRIKKRG